MVAPNPIDMDAVFEGLKNLGDNLGVLMVILTIFMVYTLLCLWARRKDRQDEIDVSHLESLFFFIFNLHSDCRGRSRGTAITCVGVQKINRSWCLSEGNYFFTLLRSCLPYL